MTCGFYAQSVFFPFKSYSYGDDETEVKICLRVGGASDTRLVH